MVPPATDPNHEKVPDEVFCRDCGQIISERAEICPECGVRQHAPPSGVPDVLAGGNPFLAALLSALLPGLGQIYNRELERGLALVVASIVSGFLVLFAVGLLLYPIVWVFAIYDAYTRAERAPRSWDERPRRGPHQENASGRSRPDDDTATDEWGSGSQWDRDESKE
jgi:TM2 domain-containing membrane protein YozV/rubredoxin